MPAARGPATCDRHGGGRPRPPARRGFPRGPMKIRHTKIRRAKIRHTAFAVIAAALAVCGLCAAGNAANTKPESQRRIGITVVSGDGWRDEEVDHTLRLLEIAERTDVPVISGAVLPLVNSAARTKAWESLYGKLVYKGAWMETWPVQGVARRAPHPSDPYLVPPSPAGAPHIKAAADTAANFLIRELRRHPGQVTIIAAGPLTNLALAARLDPEVSRLAKELVFMGGSFNPRPSNNAFAAEYANAPRREFNMRWDPEAASMVLHEPWRKITQVPIDPTTKTFFTPDMRKRIGEGNAPFAAYIDKFGQSFPMWDELAVAAWLDPSIVTVDKQLLVDVDL